LVGVIPLDHSVDESSPVGFYHYRAITARALYIAPIQPDTLMGSRNAELDESGGADLHVHTTASDGTVGVGHRIDEAIRLGLDAIAITDHDVINDDLRSPRTETEDLEIVTGVEVRGELFDTKVEILGYYVDPSNDELRTTLHRVREFRRERNAGLVDRVNATAGVDLDIETLREEVQGNLGRPHVAEALLEANVVESISEAFERYLANGADAFVPMERLPVEGVIAAIHAAGGAASLAHPGRIRADRADVEAMVDRLTDFGLDAIEVSYPYREDLSEAYAPIGTVEAATLADHHGLISTGGSDCHGPGSGKHRLGAVRVDTDALSTLRSHEL
jgi:predicted metal-dependent phosphoesterase TrpH